MPNTSHMGLRTLCVAHKELTQAEANAWLERYHTAASSMKGRAVKMACAAAEIERDMTLLGVTAIEVHSIISFCRYISPRVKLYHSATSAAIMLNTQHPDLHHTT